MEHTIQIKTAYGPAAYSFQLSETGAVTDVNCPTIELPEGLLRLTYPDAAPEELNRELNNWLPVLPWMIEPALWLEEAPDYLATVQQQFRETVGDYSSLREQVLGADQQGEEVSTPPHWVRSGQLHRLFMAGKISRLPSYRGSEKVIISAAKFGLPLRQLAADWLTTAFPLASSLRTNDWLEAMGKTRTTTANDFLFRELEKPGYLPHAKQIFTVLANSRLKLDADRIMRLYVDDDNIRDSVTAYIHLITQLPFPIVHDLLVRIVEEHPQDCLGALKRINRQDSALAQKVIRDLFLRTDDYRTLTAMLRYAVALVGNPEVLIPLADINQRLSEPSFLDDAQVTWPQKLSEGWETILLKTSTKGFTAVLQDFLPGSNGRIARNLLLQLKEYLAAQDSTLPFMPVELEAEVVRLLDSRHDKVSTVATDVLRLMMPGIHDREAAVQALLNRIAGSRYKLMYSAALKAAAKYEESARLQTAFLDQLFNEADSTDKREELLRLLPYFRFLPVVSRLEGLLK